MSTLTEQSKPSVEESVTYAEEAEPITEKVYIVTTAEKPEPSGEETQPVSEKADKITT